MRESERGEAWFYRLLRNQAADAGRSAAREQRALDEGKLVAADEGITANNAAVRLHRARAALRDKLKLACGGCARRGCLDCGCPPRTVV